MPEEITIDSLTSADREMLLEIDQAAFGFDARDMDPESDTAVIEWDRAWGARRNGELAAIYVVFSFGLSVPARPPQMATVVPMAGLSWVAVHPDHRRRGLLSAMIRHHLHDIHESGRGERVSCLFASESRIYGRFGYGLSTESRRLALPRGTTLRPLREPGPVTTRFEALDRERHRKIVEQVYDAACLLRPGNTVRPAAHWQHALEDPLSRRPSGAEALKIVTVHKDGTPTGYALLRRSPSWGEQTPEGKVRVVDAHALDPQSGHALWSRLIAFDLMEEVTTPPLALDHPLTVWAAESAAQQHFGLALWTRLVDVAAALTARGYSRDIDVVLDVSDDLCPWNAARWRLTAGPEGAVCEQTTAAADLALDVRELGSAYLGGTTLASLGTAGLVEERTPGALAACSTAWRSTVLPATPYMF
jgi:predicted acetyltransferase